MITIQFLNDNITPISTFIKNSANIKNVHFNSKLIEKDGLFFAFTQGKRDGHSFINDAIKNGASTIILSDPSYVSHDDNINYLLVNNTYDTMLELAANHRKTLNMPIISITGSNGKTTTKDILYHLLSSKFKVFKTHKNLNNHIGVPLSLLNIDNSYDFAVLELGMNHSGEIDELAKLVKPDISIITNIGESHIEFLGSTENIAKAKGEIIPHTSSNGFVVMNDSINHREILEQIDTSKTIRYVSLTNKDSDLFIQNVEQNVLGCTFVLKGETITTSLKGIHNIQNILLAIYTAFHFNLDLNEIKTALLSLTITDMRYQSIDTDFKANIINDAYNASPSSVKASIETFRNEPGRKIVVLGDMFELGVFSKHKHEEVGDYLNKYNTDFELLITIGKLSEAISEKFTGKKIHFKSNEDAVTFIKRYIHDDVTILFKASRGMMFEKIIHKLVL